MPVYKQLFEQLKGKKPVIFLDYDGTLTPIVNRPADAILDNEMRNTLEKLASMFTVAILTGRDKEDVEKLVGIKDIIYAGSHGYIISGPGGLFMEHPESANVIPRLDRMEKELHALLEGKTSGTGVDRKLYAIGIHYRNALPGDKEVVYALVEKLLQKYPGFKTGEGKMILEVKPKLDWDKGKALWWIMNALGLEDNSRYVPVFIGDDITDEDAFKAIKGRGIGILVGEHGQETAAPFHLKDVTRVKAFLDRLIAIFDNQTI